MPINRNPISFITHIRSINYSVAYISVRGQLSCADAMSGTHAEQWRKASELGLKHTTHHIVVYKLDHALSDVPLVLFIRQIGIKAAPLR